MFIEDELHVLLECPLYDDLRVTLSECLSNVMIDWNGIKPDVLCESDSLLLLHRLTASGNGLDTKYVSVFFNDALTLRKTTYARCLTKPCNVGKALLCNLQRVSNDLLSAFYFYLNMQDMFSAPKFWFPCEHDQSIYQGLKSLRGQALVQGLVI